MFLGLGLQDVPILDLCPVMEFTAGDILENNGLDGRSERVQRAVFGTTDCLQVILQCVHESAGTPFKSSSYLLQGMPGS